MYNKYNKYKTYNTGGTVNPFMDFSQGSGSTFDTSGASSQYGAAAGVIDMAGGLVDDGDATTWTAGEIATDVGSSVAKGAAAGAMLGPVGAIVGGGIGAITGIIGGAKARKQAREEQELRIEQQGENMQTQFAQQQTQERLDTAKQAYTDKLDAFEKYGVRYKEGGTIMDYDKGGLLSMDDSEFLTDGFKQYMSGGSTPGTRPEHLKYAHNLDGMIKKNYDDGGFLGNIQDNTTTRLALDAAGVFNPAAGVVASGFDFADSYDALKEGDYKSAIKSGGLGLLGLVPFGGPALKSVFKGADVVSTVAKNVDKFTPIIKGGAKAIQFANVGTQASEFIPSESNIKNIAQNIPVESPLTQDTPIREFFKTGGMTQGEFSHKTNPLTVVDNKGNDTGMELTGGEGVFDKKAMTLLDKYKANNNTKKAGELVFSEMNTWKDAGTAKYGARLKKKAKMGALITDENPIQKALDTNVLQKGFKKETYKEESNPVDPKYSEDVSSLIESTGADSLDFTKNVSNVLTDVEDYRNSLKKQKHNVVYTNPDGSKVDFKDIYGVETPAYYQGEKKINKLKEKGSYDFIKNVSTSIDKLDTLNKDDYNNFLNLANNIASKFNVENTTKENLMILKDLDISEIKQYRKKMGMSKQDLLNLIVAPPGTSSAVKSLMGVTKQTFKMFKDFKIGGKIKYK